MMSPGIRTPLKLAIFSCLFWVIPSSASAQCWFEAGFYADFYDNGIDAVEVYGAGWDQSGCSPPVCGHSYQIDAALWFNSVLVDNNTVPELEGYASYYTVVPGWVSYDVAFTITCSCAGELLVGNFGGGQQIERPTPTGEITLATNQWAADGRAIFNATLLPTHISFQGRTVREYVEGSGYDDCHFPNSNIDPFTTITGGDWPVYASNVYGSDLIGWFQDAIDYYRMTARAPCGQGMGQSMRINSGLGSLMVHYKSNALRSTIYTDSVAVSRDGVSQSRP